MIPLPITYFGVDPDLRECAFAALNSVGVLADVTFITVKPKGREAIVPMCGEVSRKARGWVARFVAAVEGQTLTYTKGHALQDVADIGVVAGAALGGFASNRNALAVYNPQPQVWKGSQPKHVNQARTFTRLGIPFGTAGLKICKDGIPTCTKGAYCYPLTPMFGLKQSQWKDAADAVGLALYAYDTYNASPRP